MVFLIRILWQIVIIQVDRRRPEAGLPGHLVCPVYLVSLVHSNTQDRRDRPDRPNEQGRLADLFSILLTAFSLLLKDSSLLEPKVLGACSTLTVLRRRTIRDHLRVVLGPKKSSTYSSEYASGFSGPAASHLASPPSPRHESNVGQAPRNREGVEWLDSCFAR